MINLSKLTDQIDPLRGDMSFETQNLTDSIGTEVRTDVASLLSADVAQKIRRLLVERGVLVFKQLNLSDEQQLSLTRLMGSLRKEGEDGIFKVTFDKEPEARPDYMKGTFLWHIDGTHDEVPVFASLLSARSLSKTGGRTEFANSYEAYQQLSPQLKQRIDGLKVVHSVEVSMRRAGIEATSQNLGFWNSLPAKVHNLVWTHPSGRKSLVIGCHASHVEGMDRGEGQTLLQELLDWTTQPKFMYRHEWSPGDMLIWDNTGVLHRAEPYPLDSGRVMHRTTLLGEEAFA